MSEIFGRGYTVVGGEKVAKTTKDEDMKKSAKKAPAKKPMAAKPAPKKGK